MDEKYFKVENLEPAKSFYLTELDTNNQSLDYVAHGEKEVCLVGSLRCQKLQMLMKSDNVLMNVGISRENVKALVASANNIVTLYFYLSDDSYFSIDFNFNDFRERLRSIGAMKITNLNINPLKLQQRN